MSLRSHPDFVVPTETARITRAACPNGTLCLRIADRLGTIFRDADFAHLFPPQGQPALTPVRLALVTVLQFVEGLSDRQAADAVRTRIDWKHLLCLELTDPGFDFSVLSEFRSRLVNAHAEALAFDLLLSRLCDEGLVTARGRQRTDSTHVLAAVRAMNRLECVVETMRHALASLAAVVPYWLREHAQAEWTDRYGRRADDYRLPKADTQREVYAEQVGADGWELLSAVYSTDAPDWLARVPAVDTMRRVWLQQFVIVDSTVRWRHSSNTPPSSLMISSPYDVEAHYARKRSTSWIGYKVHLTETCDDERSRFITHVRRSMPRRATPTRSRQSTRRWQARGCCQVDTWSTPGTSKRSCS